MVFLDDEELAVDKRLKRVRELMRETGVDVLIVRGTDQHLNEYVPQSQNLRLWVTGFTGSVGDAIVTGEKAFVFVDGRYHMQAESEVDSRYVQVVKVPFGVVIEEAVERKLVEIVTEGTVVGYEAEKFSLSDFARLRALLERKDARPLAPPENLVVRARGGVRRRRPVELEAIPDSATGESTQQKLGRLREALERQGVNGIMITRLDEIAWLTNLRSYELDHNATFRARAYVGRDTAVLFLDKDKLTPAVEKVRGRHWVFESEDEWKRSLGKHLAPSVGLRVLVSPTGTTVAVVEALRALLGERGKVIEGLSPLAAMKARKNPVELATMTDSFRAADKVVAQAIAWLNRIVARKKAVTEADFADKVESLFQAAGARSLSFRVISAAGQNGAIIHYSDPDPGRKIKSGELMLLDTGAYFEPGYATDLTRTFLVGGGGAKPNKKQKLIYTLVLKGAVRGMKARFPVGSTCVQLDTIVRAPIWEGGYDYLHGTGHGIGVLVHEFPPRIAPKSMTPLEAGMVFSIEPGIYLPGWGGVRIENIVTVEVDPKVEGYLRVRPLTFSGLDRRLIDMKMLSLDEKAWLRRYHRGRV